MKLAGGISGEVGFAMDVAGNLPVCNGRGVRLDVLEVAGTALTDPTCTGGIVSANLANGGPNNKTLFITDSDAGTILQTELPTEGSRMFGLI